MPENLKPQDPMLAAAYAHVVATELEFDAKTQTEACQHGGETLGILADALAQVAALLHGDATAFNVEQVPRVRAALENIVTGLRAVGVGVKHAETRFSDHAAGWAREAKFWKSIVDQSATPVVPK